MYSIYYEIQMLQIFNCMILLILLAFDRHFFSYYYCATKLFNRNYSNCKFLITGYPSFVKLNSKMFNKFSKGDENFTLLFV